MPRDSVSILQKLLTREPDQRLGSGPTDAQEIMSQPFFRNINWDDVYHKRIQPPFLPQISSATDTSNFDSEFTSVTPVLTPVQSGEFAPEGLLISEHGLTFGSTVAGYARRVPWILIFGGFHMSEVVMMATLTLSLVRDCDMSLVYARASPRVVMLWHRRCSMSGTAAAKKMAQCLRQRA